MWLPVGDGRGGAGEGASTSLRRVGFGVEDLWCIVCGLGLRIYGVWFMVEARVEGLWLMV